MFCSLSPKKYPNAKFIGQDPYIICRHLLLILNAMDVSGCCQVKYIYLYVKCNGLSLLSACYTFVLLALNYP